MPNIKSRTWEQEMLSIGNCPGWMLPTCLPTFKLVFLSDTVWPHSFNFSSYYQTMLFFSPGEGGGVIFGETLGSMAKGLEAIFA